MKDRIAEHNRTIAEMIQQKHELEVAINRRLFEEGDLLKFEEIMAFVRENNLNRIWFKERDGVTRVYGGELFDFGGLSVELKANGSASSQNLFHCLSQVATPDYKEMLKDCNSGMDTKLIRIVTYTFE